MSRLKLIEGYDKYYVSDDGKIYSDKYSERRELIPRQASNGYLYVNLCKNGKYKSVRIHRIVAKYFLSDYDEFLEVNHKDGNKLNNKMSNLEMVTHGGNIRHAVENGLHRALKGEEHWCSKLTEENVKEIRKKYQPYVYTQKMLAEEYGVSEDDIKLILSNRTWKDLV